jgi:hypothetical protein
MPLKLSTRVVLCCLAAASTQLYASSIVWTTDASGTNVGDGPDGIAASINEQPGGGDSNFIANGLRDFTVTSPGEFIFSLTASVSGDVECEVVGGCGSPTLEMDGIEAEIFPAILGETGFSSLSIPGQTCQYPSCGVGTLIIFQPGVAGSLGGSVSTTVFLDAGDYRMDVPDFHANESGAARLAFLSASFDAELTPAPPVPEPRGYALLIALPIIAAAYRRWWRKAIDRHFVASSGSSM